MAATGWFRSTRWATLAAALALALGLAGCGDDGAGQGPDVPASDATADTPSATVDGTADIDAGSAADTGPDADAEAVADTGPDADAEAVADAGPDADAEAVADTGPDADTEADADTGPDLGGPDAAISDTLGPDSEDADAQAIDVAVVDVGVADVAGPDAAADVTATEVADSAGEADAAADATATEVADSAGQADAAADVTATGGADSAGPTDAAAEVADVPKPVCTPGEKACDGANLTTCSADGLGWTATSCDDANACTADACSQGACTHTPVADASACGGKACEAKTCQQGVCQASPAPLWTLTPPPPAPKTAGTFSQAVALPDGGFAVIGQSEGSTWLVKLAAAGTALLNTTGPQDYGTVAYALRWTGDGFLLATKDKGIVRLNANFGKVWDTVASAGPNAFADVQALPGNHAVGLLSGFSPFALQRFDDKGQLLWEKSPMAPDGSFSASRLNVTDSEIQVLGTAKVSAQAPKGGPYLLRLGHDGVKQAMVLVGEAVGFGPNWSIAGSCAAPGGGFQVLLWQVNSQAARIARIDGKGQVPWVLSLPGKVNNFGPPTCLPDGSGALAMAHHDGSVPYTLARWNKDGILQLVRTVSTQHKVSGLVAAADGFLLLGTVGDGPAWLARTDWWGHFTCAASGTCSGKGMDDCADGNPCSGDVCAAGTCSHPVHPDETSCSALGFCSAGLCK